MGYSRRMMRESASLKYEITDETMEWRNGEYTLHRIRALKNFGDVKAGDLGGWIESENNLSQEGNCWVFDDAKVYGNAKVYENAEIAENAQVYDNAEVYGRAMIFGNAKVIWDAQVYDRADVAENAIVYGDAEVYGSAYVTGKAQVHGDAIVCGDALVEGDADVFGSATVDYAVSEGEIYESRRLRGRMIRESRLRRGRMLKEDYYDYGELSKEEIKDIAQKFVDEGNPNPSRAEVFDVVHDSKAYAPEFEYAWEEFGEDSPELEGLFKEVEEAVNLVMKELRQRR